MNRHYQELKNLHHDAVLAFTDDIWARFYEQDAKDVARVLGLTIVTDVLVITKYEFLEPSNALDTLERELGKRVLMV